MATIKICDFITAFQEGKHIATSYQFYDGVTNKVIDESIMNTVSLTEWTSELKDGNGGHYRNLSDLRARINIHYDGSDSGWIYLGSYDQTDPLQPIHTCTI
jgi:hypothetical protein